MYLYSIRLYENLKGEKIMKKILTIVLAAVMLAVGVSAAFEKVNTYSNNFSDVKEANWFYENFFPSEI